MNDHGFIATLRSSRIVVVLAGLATILAFALVDLPVASAQALTVFAAASLKDALDELDALWRAQGRDGVVVSYAASSALAKQVENGAPADVFICADIDWMDYLDQRHLLKPGTRVDLLRNDIVLVSPADSSASVTIGPGFALAQALGNGRLAMADPDAVPAGKYGKAALEKLGVWSSVAGRIARGEDVRAALNFVARGEAPLGIVYRTDAAAEPRVRIVGTFPADSHPPIVYPAALLVQGRNAAAGDYLAYLRSSGAAAVFRKHGFVPY